MKTFTALLTFFLVAGAEASWMNTKCSNSDGTVTWEKSHDQNLINLKYANFVEGTLTLEMEQVNVQFSKEFTLKEKVFRNCSVAGSSRVYAGKVKITGSEKHPDVLRSQFPENKVQTEVICTTTVMTDLPCTPE